MRSKLRTLFTPGALAATAATGLLIGSTVKAIAGYFEVSAAVFPPEMQEPPCAPYYCYGYCWDEEPFFEIYWCCIYYNVACPGHAGTVLSCGEPLMGQCWAPD